MTSGYIDHLRVEQSRCVVVRYVHICHIWCDGAGHIWELPLVVIAPIGSEFYLSRVDVVSIAVIGERVNETITGHQQAILEIDASGTVGAESHVLYVNVLLTDAVAHCEDVLALLVPGDIASQAEPLAADIDRNSLLD